MTAKVNALSLGQMFFNVSLTPGTALMRSPANKTAEYIFNLRLQSEATCSSQDQLTPLPHPLLQGFGCTVDWVFAVLIIDPGPCMCGPNPLPLPTSSQFYQEPHLLSSLKPLWEQPVMGNKQKQVLTSYVSTSISLVMRGCSGVGNFTDVMSWKLC